MRIAAHGMISDSGGSSAGAFPRLLRVLLEQGHEVVFFGVKNFTEPKSLEPCPNYRFHRIRVAWSRRVAPYFNGLPTRYPKALRSLISHVGFQKEAISQIEATSPAFDVVLCLDVPNIWKCKIPMLSWPQAPPHTEWSALRRPHNARAMIEGQGAVFYGAVQLFYALRWVQGKAALGSSDLVLCGSPWARDEWIRFGVPPERVKLQPYPIDLGGLSDVPLANMETDVTFLWLGRSVPRKRIDLFLDGFELVRQRHPTVRARLVGQLAADPAAERRLARYRNDPNVSFTEAVARSAVPALFAESHVLVQPSENENFGFSIAEALAAGRPVVAGPTNGTAAFGGSALFPFATYDAQSVAEAMERARAAVLADPQAVAATARSAAHRHFTPEQVANQILAHARSAIEARGSARVTRSTSAA